MNEQEAQKKAFKQWEQFNGGFLRGPSTGHERGWEDALEWVKHGQKPAAWLWPRERDPFICATKTEKAPGFDFWDKTPKPVYDHPAPQPDVSDYEETIKGHKKLVRELDLLLNGTEGASEQASLCDIVAQVRRSREKQQPDVAELVEALKAFIFNSSCQTNYPDECERAEKVLTKWGNH